MNTNTKKRLLIGTIIVLLIINISALSTMIYHNKLDHKRYEDVTHVQDEIRERGMRRYLQQELNLSEEQLAEFHKINTKFSSNTREITYQLSTKRHDMMNEIAKLNPNLNKLDQIADDIGELHYDLKRETIHHFLELKDICNDEQQRTLQKMFLQMLSHQDRERMERGPHGKGRRERERSPYRNRNQ